MGRKTKHEQLQGHLDKVRKLRQQLADEEKKAKRKRHDDLAGALEEMGLDEAVLTLSREDRQRIGALESPEERTRALAKLLHGPGQPGVSDSPAAQEGAPGTLGQDSETDRGGFFGGR